MNRTSKIVALALALAGASAVAFAQEGAKPAEPPHAMPGMMEGHQEQGAGQMPMADMMTNRMMETCEAMMKTMAEQNKPANDGAEPNNG